MKSVLVVGLLLVSSVGWADSKVTGDVGITGTTNNKAGSGAQLQGSVKSEDVKAHAALGTTAHVGNADDRVRITGSVGATVSACDRVCLVVGEPLLVHSDGVYGQFGLNPFMGTMGFKNKSSSLVVMPRAMGVWDARNNVSAWGGGVQVTVDHKFNEQLEFEGIFQVAAIEGKHPQGLSRSGNWVMAEAGLKWHVTPDVVINGSAAISDMSLTKDTSVAGLKGETDPAGPSLTAKAGLNVAF